MNDYYDSAEGLTISRERAIQELINHGCIPQDNGDFLDTRNGDAFEFFNEMGDHAEYDAQAVLEWLGY